MVVGLLFCWWDVSDGFEKPSVVEPVHVFEGGVLEVVEVLPGSAFVDEFCLVQADDGFGEGVIVRIAHGSDRWFDVLERFCDLNETGEQPESHDIVDTIIAWSNEILAWHHTGRPSNGRIEGSQQPAPITRLAPRVIRPERGEQIVMGDKLALCADEAISREPAARSFGVWSEGFIVDDAGCLIHTYQVNVPGPASESSADGWPLFRPVLVKVCEQQHLIDTCATLLLRKPKDFRDAGETLMSDPEEARVSREWTTDERLNDATEMARARLLDEEANRGSELVGSTMKSTTNEVKSRRSRRSTVDRGSSGWLWCSAVEPTNDAEWVRLCSDLPAAHDQYWTFRSPRMFARALGAMVVDQLGPLGRMSNLTHSPANDVTLHKSLTVFHGPVAYVKDPYGYVAESATPLEHLLRPLFVKRLEYEHQREYRFVVWDEGEPKEGPKLLNASPALLETTRGLASGLVPVPRSTTTPRTPPPAARPLPLGSSTLPALDPLLDSLCDLANDPYINHGVRTIRAEDAPANLQEKTEIYPAVETLRQIVGKVDNKPSGSGSGLARRAVHPSPLLCVPRPNRQHPAHVRQLHRHPSEVPRKHRCLRQHSGRTARDSASQGWARLRLHRLHQRQASIRRSRAAAE